MSSHIFSIYFLCYVKVPAPQSLLAPNSTWSTQIHLEFFTHKCTGNAHNGLGSWFSSEELMCLHSMTLTCLFFCSDSHSVADSQSTAVQHPLLEHTQSCCSTQPSHTASGSPPIPGHYRKDIYFVSAPVSLYLCKTPELFPLCSALVSNSPHPPVPDPYTQYGRDQHPWPHLTRPSEDIGSIPPHRQLLTLLPHPGQSRGSSVLTITHHSGAVMYTAMQFTLQPAVWREDLMDNTFSLFHSMCTLRRLLCTRRRWCHCLYAWIYFVWLFGSSVTTIRRREGFPWQQSMHMD